MQQTWAWALLVLAVTVGANRDCNCDCLPEGAEVVTYGEPCFCKQTLPYAVQVPQIQKASAAPIGGGKTYSYELVQTPATEGTIRYYELPVQIEAPVYKSSSSSSLANSLNGKSYEIDVEYTHRPQGPKQYTFEYAVQQPMQQKKLSVDRMVNRQYPVQVQKIVEQPQHTTYFAPIPYGVEQPAAVKSTSNQAFLKGLTSKIDRVLVPACEVDICPYCKDLPKGNCRCNC